MPGHESDLERLINRLRKQGYLNNSRLEHALRVVPRHEFVPAGVRSAAYHDTPLPIGSGQTISAPHMCVIMCEALKLSEGHTVLEVGTGSGYHAALCAELVAPAGTEHPGHVYTVEIIQQLADFARENLERIGYSDRVTVVHGDGGLGLPDYAPYDRILVAAAAPRIPDPLIEQLAEGGIMVIPVGRHGFYQELMLIEKGTGDEIRTRRWGGVAFVPLTGKYGR